MHSRTSLIVVGALAFAALIAFSQAPPAAPSPAPGRGGGGGGGGGGGRAGRFKIYPQAAIDRGLPTYNTTCG